MVLVWTVGRAIDRTLLTAGVANKGCPALLALAGGRALDRTLLNVAVEDKECPGLLTRIGVIVPLRSGLMVVGETTSFTAAQQLFCRLVLHVAAAAPERDLQARYS